MIRYQQAVFPLCTEIQLSVIAQFGFQPDGEGIIQVALTIVLSVIYSVSFLVHPAYQDYGEGGSGNCKTSATRQELFHPSDASSNEQQSSFQALVWKETLNLVIWISIKCSDQQQKIFAQTIL